MPWLRLKGSWAGFVQLGNHGCSTCSLQLPNGWLEKIQSQPLQVAASTLLQVHFALKMLQNQRGNQRGCQMLIPGNTQHFIGHSPEKFHLLSKLALLWSGGWPGWPPEVPPNLNYSMILKTENIKASFSVADTRDNCLLPYAAWLYSNPFI